MNPLPLLIMQHQHTHKHARTYFPRPLLQPREPPNSARAPFLRLGQYSVPFSALSQSAVDGPPPLLQRVRLTQACDLQAVSDMGKALERTLLPQSDRQALRLLSYGP